VASDPNRRCKAARGNQPRLNDLLRGRVGKFFSFDALVALAARRPRGAFGNHIGRIGMARKLGDPT
jgi:hypothetical protein